MAFWDFFPKKKPAFNKVLIDIGPNSVGGAYVCYRDDEKPTILSAQRLEYRGHADEPLERAMLRALHELGEKLIREGAPRLARATGRGAADAIAAAVDAPWAQAMLITKHIFPREPVIFTHEFVSEALRDAELPHDRLFAGHTLIHTVLNGYPTREPYGKTASRATIQALASHADWDVSKDIVTCLRDLFHIDRISFIASPALRHQAMRAAFPHENNVGLYDAMSSAPTLLHLPNNGPVTLKDIPNNEALVAELTALKNSYTSPRTLFVLDRDPDTSSWRTVLTSRQPVAISIRPSHLSPYVSHALGSAPDLSLSLMVLHSTTPA